MCRCSVLECKSDSERMLQDLSFHSAAFEAVSRVSVRPINRASFIDVRLTRLPSETPSLDDFDPKQHRKPINPIKPWMAYFNLFRTAFGAGVLGLPLAISKTGILLGPMLAIGTGFLIIHTHLMLLSCLNEISRQLKIPYISYRYGFRLALLRGPPIFEVIGEYGPTIIATLMIVSQLGICTVFVDFTTDSLRDIMDWDSSKPALIALLLPYLLLEFSMKSLKIVSYVSMFGNVLNIMGVILVFFHLFKDRHNDEVILASTTLLPILFAFGTFLFNLSAVGVILSLDKALLHPEILTERYGIIRLGIFIPVVIGTIFGSLGYLSFGTMEENVLRSLPFDEDTAMAAIGLYLIAIAFAYPIQCYPAIQIIIEVLKNSQLDCQPSDKTLKMVEIIARPVFVLISFFVCYLIPFQGPFVAFVGNLCTTMLALVFPAMMEISLRYPDNYGKYNGYLYKNIILIAIGVTSWIFGCFLCGYLIYVRIISRYHNNKDYFR